MNKERMLALADFIEKLPAHKFDMSNWAFDKGNDNNAVDPKALNPHQCKTAGCIAGWAIHLFAERSALDYNQVPYPQTEARQVLDLTDFQAHDLFYGHWFNHGISAITREIAATHLRNLANKAT